MIVLGEGRFSIANTISGILKPKFETKMIAERIFPWFIRENEILIFTLDLEKTDSLKDLVFLLKNSDQPIMVISGQRENSEGKDGDRYQEFTEKTTEVAKLLPSRGFLIANFDERIFRRIKGQTSARFLTYGFLEGADFQVTDVNTGAAETNFKINYGGDIVPFWLKKAAKKEEIYDAISAVCAGAAKGMNLVEISQALKNLIL